MPRLKARGYADIVAIDKHPHNTATLRRLHPDISVVEADLATGNGWQAAVAGVAVAVIAHAQIGGVDPAAFIANNVTATQRLLDALRPGGAYLVHISTSAVKLAIENRYCETKLTQERLVADCGLPSVILRPTLMFGWFDRKHLGWLARFMRRSPLFPIPGTGRYPRQPLYAGDFCDIVMSCIERQPTGAVYDISGLERIDYIDLIRAIRQACEAHARLVQIPYGLFWRLLDIYALFDRSPPFTTEQLEALVTPDLFDVIDWPGIFGVQATPLAAALEQTFRHPLYSTIVLEF